MSVPDDRTAWPAPELAPVPYIFLPVWLNVLLHLLAWILLLGWMLQVVPAMQEAFSDFGMALPEVIELLLAIADALAVRPAVWITGLVVGGVVDAVIDRALVRTAQYRLRMVLLLFRLATPVLLLVVAAVVLQLPVLVMLKSMGR